jgi:hypothetical protein
MSRVTRTRNPAATVLIIPRLLAAKSEKIDKRKGKKGVSEKNANKENDIDKPSRIEVLQKDRTQGHHQTDQPEKNVGSLCGQNVKKAGHNPCASN